MEKKLLLVTVIITLAFSSCIVTGVSMKETNTSDIKILTVKSSDNLSSYSLTSLMNQTMRLNHARSNAIKGDMTTLDSIKTVTSVNLTSLTARANASIKELIDLPSKAENIRTSQATTYQIGNSTYAVGQNGKWIQLRDKRDAKTVWGKDNNNPVKMLAEKINQSQVEIIGSEKIGGEDTYKLKIFAGNLDYHTLYNTALSVAARIINDSTLVPGINRSEVNKTFQMSMFVWISKDTYLPVQYQSDISFNATPMVVGSIDPITRQIKSFNQSMSLGEVSIDSETINVYYNFNKPVEISLPKGANAAISPNSIKRRVVPSVETQNPPYEYVKIKPRY